MSFLRGARAELLFVLLLLPLVGSVLLAAGLGSFPGARGSSQALLGLASLSWVAALALAPRLAPSGPLAGAWIAGALALRLAVLAGDPGLSDDVWRYVWEGGLVAEGRSPYAHAPDSPELAPERERWAEVAARVNHPGVAAAYPPLTQAVNAAVVALAGGPGEEDGEAARRGMRLAYLGFDLAVLLPLVGLLRLRGRPTTMAVAWAWCPLVALEFAGSAHFDSLGVLGLVAALFLAELARAREVSFAAVGAPLVLAWGTLVKFLPVAALPFLARERAHPVRALLLFVVGGALGFLPLVWLEGGLAGITGGLSEYALRWESFNLVFRWIEDPLAWFLSMDEGLFDPRRLARGVVLLAWLGVGIRLWLRKADALRAAFVLTGAFLVLTPTLHPWYLTWIVPFLAFSASRAWIFLLAVAPLMYWPLTEWHARGEWIEPVWLWPVVAAPFFLMLALELPSRLRGAP